MADKRYNNKLQAIFDYAHNEPYVRIGLDESPIATSRGLIKSGIGDVETKSFDRSPRTREDMREMVREYPQAFPKMSELLKIAGTQELGGNGVEGDNTTFSNPSIAKELASCGHSKGAPYCNFTAKLAARKAGDIDMDEILTGGSQSTYGKAKNSGKFQIGDSPQEQGEFLQLNYDGDKFKHTRTGIYDKASGNTYAIEGNSFGQDPYSKKKRVFEGIVENYRKEGDEGDKFIQKKKSKAKELAGR